MKSFAILLIILNVGFFTWLQGWLEWMPWQPQDIMPPSQAVKPSKSDLPSLSLLNEKNAVVTVAKLEPPKAVETLSHKTSMPALTSTAVSLPVSNTHVALNAATSESTLPKIVTADKTVKPEDVPPKTTTADMAKPVENPVVTNTSPVVENTPKITETLASAVKTTPMVTDKAAEPPKNDKLESVLIPPPRAVVTAENNPIAAFAEKAKAGSVNKTITSSAIDKPSDTGLSTPVQESKVLDSAATPTTTVAQLPPEVVSAINTVKLDLAHTVAAAETVKMNNPEKNVQDTNSSSTLPKNSATMPAFTPVAEESTKTIQTVKKEDKMPLKSSSSNELCFVAGPYAQLAGAQTSAKWFKGKSTVRAEVQSDDVPTVYWVYLPPYKNQKEASRQAQHLAHLGITDYVLVTTGKLSHAISLGVYRDQASAQRRVDELHRKGYKRARTEKQRQGNKRYWLNVKMPIAQKELMSSFKRAQKISAIEVNVCE